MICTSNAFYLTLGNIQVKLAIGSQKLSIRSNSDGARAIGDWEYITVPRSDASSISREVRSIVSIPRKNPRKCRQHHMPVDKPKPRADDNSIVSVCSETKHIISANSMTKTTRKLRGIIVIDRQFDERNELAEGVFNVQVRER